MPFMDGYEATSQIRLLIAQAGLRQPIISAVSGHIEPIYVQKAIDSGMNQVLSKPVDVDLLRDLLERLRFL